jgi:hypothetical protein
MQLRAIWLDIFSRAVIGLLGVARRRVRGPHWYSCILNNEKHSGVYHSLRLSDEAAGGYPTAKRCTLQLANQKR